MKKVLIINGPNLGLVGNGGSQKFIESVNAKVFERSKSLGITCGFVQSNSEGGLVSAIHSALDADGVILNACEFTHYSIAIRDAISSIKTPVVEVRPEGFCGAEEFRQVSMLSPVCLGSISGFGSHCYILALYALADNFGIM